MKSISQVAKLTGISIRTLQYYDENALQTLQQILFFKELGFSLKEIKEILENPDFDRIAAFKKQKELFLLKRNRINRLIQLLERLEKGEHCTSFKEFDLSDYISALEDFKTNQAETVTKHWGSIENFDMFIQKIRDDEDQVAKLAIQQFGSVENYTEQMKYNLEHFSEIMETQLPEKAKEIARQSDMLYGKLTADLSVNVSSPEIQSIVHSIDVLIRDNGGGVSLAKPYIHVLIDAYSNDYIRSITDKKYKKGASDYIAKAFRYYAEHHPSDSN